MGEISLSVESSKVHHILIFRKSLDRGVFPDKALWANRQNSENREYLVLGDGAGDGAGCAVWGKAWWPLV